MTWLFFKIHFFYSSCNLAGPVNKSLWYKNCCVAATFFLNDRDRDTPKLKYMCLLCIKYFIFHQNKKYINGVFALYKSLLLC
jgi:hypothetical protein